MWSKFRWNRTPNLIYLSWFRSSTALGAALITVHVSEAFLKDTTGIWNLTENKPDRNYIFFCTNHHDRVSPIYKLAVNSWNYSMPHYWLTSVCQYIHLIRERNWLKNEASLFYSIMKWNRESENSRLYFCRFQPWKERLSRKIDDRRRGNQVSRHQKDKKENFNLVRNQDLCKWGNPGITWSRYKPLID